MYLQRRAVMGQHMDLPGRFTMSLEKFTLLKNAPARQHVEVLARTGVDVLDAGGHLDARPRSTTETPRKPGTSSWAFS